MSLTPIKDGTGFVTNFVAVLSDVTERKASEAAFQLRDHALSNLNEVRAPEQAAMLCPGNASMHGRGMQKPLSCMHGGACKAAGQLHDYAKSHAWKGM